MKRMDRRTTTIYVKPQTGLLQRNSKSLSDLHANKVEKSAAQAKYSVRNTNRKILGLHGRNDTARRFVSVVPKLFTIDEMEEENFSPLICERNEKDYSFFKIKTSPVKTLEEIVCQEYQNLQFTQEQFEQHVDRQQSNFQSVFEQEITQTKVDDKRIEQSLVESFSKNSQFVIQYLIKQLSNEPQKIITHILTLFSVPEFFQHQSSTELVKKALAYSTPAQAQIIRIAIRVQISNRQIAKYMDIVEKWRLILN